MKKLTVLIFFTLHFSLVTFHSSAQSCLPEGITFSTQEQIDNFYIVYPNCTEIEGDVVIGGSYPPNYDITNLVGLSQLTSIEGQLIITWNNVLTDLTGLHNLDSIGGTLQIAGNDALTSLSGLEDLNSIGGDLIIGGDELTSLLGLFYLNSIGGSLVIYNSDELIDLTGLNNVTSIGGSIEISHNNSLTSLSGIDNIDPASIMELHIAENQSLSTCEVQSICGYLAEPNGDIYIYQNNDGCDCPEEIAENCGITLPCLPNYYFSKQSQIDNFQANFPECTELVGDVTVSGWGIADLEGLNIITSIGGNFEMDDNNDLFDLSGLENLTTIGNDLIITSNDNLLNITGLEGLNYIGGGISIYDNYDLISLTGLEGLTTINGSIILGHSDWGGNASLTSLSGLNNITSIGGDLDIINDHSLTNLTGLNYLTSLGANFNISNNDALININALGNLTSIGGDFGIGCGNLTSISGLGNLIVVGGDLIIGSTKVSSLAPLSGLTSIGGDLMIWTNDFLSDLAGLNNVSSIGGDLTIGRTEQLTSLAGIDNIDAGSINNIRIVNNPSLSTCGVESICDYLSNPGGSVEIYGNAPGCNNPPEIANACGFTMDCLPYGNYYFLTQEEIDNFMFDYPNCSELYGYTEISGKDINNLNGLTVVETMEDIRIFENDNLTNLSGLDNLTTVGGSLNIGIPVRFGFNGNPLLTSLSGLSNLNSVGEHLYILGNYMLNDISKLNSLLSIGGELNIVANESLQGLSGLGNIDPNSITYLLIGGNFSLSGCEVQSICDYLAAPNGTIEISQNAPGCNSPEEVEEACQSVSVPEKSIESNITISPNPCSGRAYIRYQISDKTCPARGEGYLILDLYSIDGVMIKRLLNEVKMPGEYEVEIDVSDVPSGVYFCTMKTDGGVVTVKMIKL